MAKELFLGDLKNMTERGIVDHICESYESKEEDVNKYYILIAYESVGRWGCDSTSWFLLRDKKSKELFENYGSHCSCYGFEGQWKPEPTNIDYLKSDKFSLPIGGYDTNESENEKAVKKFIMNLKK